MTALRRLLAAQIPADFADLLDFVAIAALLTYHWQAPTVAFAWFAVAMALPYLVIGPLAGLAVDRIDTRYALVASNLGRGAASAVMSLAPTWEVLLALVALRSVADSFFTPAKQAAIQTLAPGAQASQANSASHAINQASKIIAPSLGGLALVWLTPASVFLITAAISLLAAALLTRLPALPRTATLTGLSLGAQLAEGWAEVRHKPVVARVLTLMTLGYFAMFFYDTLIAPLLRDLGQSATGLGLAIGAVGAGGVLGALTLGRGAGPPRPFRWIAAGAALSAAMIALAGLAALSGHRPSLALIATLFAVVGYSTALTLIPTRTLLQAHVDPARMGRVTALAEAANALAILVAPFLGAALADRFGPGAAFLAGACVLAALSLAALRAP